MEVISRAYGFAGTFEVRGLASVFAGASIRTTKKQLVARYSETSAAIAFDFGALVFVDVSAEERARVIAAATAKLDGEEPHAPLEETFTIDVDPSAPPEGVVGFDRARVQSLGGGELEVLALLLAQSVCIDYYEEDLRAILVQIDKHVDVMRKTGRTMGTTRELARFVAQAIDTRTQIIAALDMLDKPTVTWESEPLDRMYRAMRATLELEERFQALDYKLRSIQDTLELLLDLRQTSRMLFLETTVVLLIVLEVVLALLKKI
ncbi:MAG: RMD1 family protein [Polyangiaceae bacterium]